MPITMRESKKGGIRPTYNVIRRSNSQLIGNEKSSIPLTRWFALTEWNVCNNLSTNQDTEIRHVKACKFVTVSDEIEPTRLLREMMQK